MGTGWQLARALCPSLGGDWKESTGFGPIWGSAGGPACFQLPAVELESSEALARGFAHVAKPRAFLVPAPDRGHPHLFWSLMSHCLKSLRKAVEGQGEDLVM